MAVILKEKELIFADAWIAQCKALAQALYNLNVLKQRIASGGVVWSDADLATDPRTHHTTAAQLAQSAAVVSEVLTYFGTASRREDIEVVLRD